LRQCDKFGFTTLKEDLDGRLAKAIDVSRRDFLHLMSTSSSQYTCADPNKHAFKAIQEFELPKCENAVMEYLLEVIKQNGNRTVQRTALGHKRDNTPADAAKNRIVRIIRELHEAGRYKLCSELTQAAIKRDLFLFQI